MPFREKNAAPLFWMISWLRKSLMKMNMEEKEYEVVRSKRFPVKPLVVEEAILQMNMVGHQFYMYRNAETGEINIVYKRKMVLTVC